MKVDGGASVSNVVAQCDEQKYIGLLLVFCWFIVVVGFIVMLYIGLMVVVAADVLILIVGVTWLVCGVCGSGGLW